METVVPTHSIVHEEGRCIGCVACCKACPAKAIRVWNGLMEVSPALCVDCGECIRACTRDAVRARTSSPSDLHRFGYTVAVPAMALYTQFGPDVRPEQVAGALLANGFDAFYDGSSMCRLVSSAVDTYLSDCPGPWPKVSVTCPAVIRLIQLRYPDLVPHLIPVHTPRELAAKAARRKFAAERRLPPEQIGVFFITPCSAIMQSIVSPVGLHESYFDGAFSIAELYGPVLKAIKAGAMVDEAGFDPAGGMWALAGGETAAMRNKNTLVVSGVKDIVYVFDSIEAGRFQSVDFIEAYICPDGCVSGQLLIEGRYAARRTLQRVASRQAEEKPVDEEKIRSMFREHFFDMEDEIKARPIQAIPGDVREAVRRRQEKNRVLERLPRKDCAACGAPDCMTHAEDVVDGRARVEECVFLRLEELERGEQGPGPRA